MRATSGDNPLTLKLGNDGEGGEHSTTVGEGEAYQSKREREGSRGLGCVPPDRWARVLLILLPEGVDCWVAMTGGDVSRPAHMHDETWRHGC